MLDQHELVDGGPATVQRRRLGPVRRAAMMFVALVAGLGAAFVAPTAAHAYTACDIYAGPYYGQYLCEFGYTPVQWSDGHYQVFIVGTDHKVYHSWEYGGVWEPWHSLGGEAYSSVNIKEKNINSIDIRVYGSTGRWYCKKSNTNGTWPTNWRTSNCPAP